MTAAATSLDIQLNAPIPTWFHIGGSAKRLARPQNPAELLACLEIDDELRVLGEGANLLVADEGVSDLVVSLQTEGFRRVDIDKAAGLVRAGAGAALPSLINRCVRAGLGGLEVLAGIPATMGGAVIMNAGGTFGSLADVVLAVHAVDRAGREHTIERPQIDFGYRQSHLNHLIVTEVVLQLTPGDIGDITASRDRCMKHKAQSQPLSQRSAGCVFKNPTLVEPIDGVGEAKQRVSAGLLIDRASCKGMSVGGASVSHVHANFLTTGKDARAAHVIELIELVRQRVFDSFGVSLHNELVIWRDHPSHENASRQSPEGGQA